MQKYEIEKENGTEDGLGKMPKTVRLKTVSGIFLLLLISSAACFSAWKWQLAEQEKAQVQHDLLITLDKLGDSFLHQNQPVKALSFYQQAFHLSQELAEEKPENPRVQRDLSVSLERLGTLYSLLNQTDMALEFYQRCLKIRKNLTAQSPDNPDVQRDLLVSFTNLGNLYQKRKEKHLALAAFYQALLIVEKTAKDKSNFLAQEDLVWVQNRLADIQNQH